MKSFLSNNWKVVVGILIIVVAFSFGRYTAPTKVETKTVTVEVEKVKIDRNRIVIEKTNKDGSKIKITRSSSMTDRNTQTSQQSTKLVENKSSLNISALAGVDVTKPTGIVFGAHVSKQLIGPVSIGVFGLTNKTVGASIGLSF
jgi:hypothetical protein